MNEKFLPTTREGKLDRLIEECAEVIQAVQKLKRFGPGPNMVDGVEFPDNIEHLLDEMKDLEHALSQVRCIDLGKVKTPDRSGPVFAIDKMVTQRQEQLAGYDVVALTFAEAYAALRRECPAGDLRIHLRIETRPCVKCGCPEHVHETVAYRGDKSRACLSCRMCAGFE